MNTQLWLYVAIQLQCVAVVLQWSVLQCVAVRCSVPSMRLSTHNSGFHCRDRSRCSAIDVVAVHCDFVALHCGCAAVCCRVLQCVAAAALCLVSVYT